MNIQLLSDLHLEVAPGFVPRPAPGADVLVLAGDVGAHTPRSRLGADPARGDFGLSRFSPRLGWPTPVLYVPGNHEYDGQPFEAVHARLQALCAELGIVWLEGQVWQAPGTSVRFIGSTLWADFDALGRQPEARRKAHSAANWYLQTTGSTIGGVPLLAEQVRTLALQSQDWLRHALTAPQPDGTPFTGQTVVVTHFAPSTRSADPRYGLTPGTAGFCNALDDLLPHADLWLHGHLHCKSDYRAGRCRVVANPLGYANKGEQAAFDGQLVLRV
ncbi:MAG: hypothetical protein RLZZ126_129 [Pseudomonadota bacterium]|jgi:hypothetical protein